MGAKNRVIAGDYTGIECINAFGTPALFFNFHHSMILDSKTVEGYELITDEHTKSASSAVGRGIVGGLLLGPIGMLGGALSGKNKGIYVVAIKFKDGKNSLLEVDQKIYMGIVENCFSPSKTSEKDAIAHVGKTYIDELKELKNLLDQGVINQQEFDVKKKTILFVGNSDTSTVDLNRVRETDKYVFFKGQSNTDLLEIILRAVQSESIFLLESYSNDIISYDSENYTGYFSKFLFELNLQKEVSTLCQNLTKFSRYSKEISDEEHEIIVSLFNHSTKTIGNIGAASLLVSLYCGESCTINRILYFGANPNNQGRVFFTNKELFSPSEFVAINMISNPSLTETIAIMKKASFEELNLNIFSRLCELYDEEDFDIWRKTLLANNINSFEKWSELSIRIENINLIKKVVSELKSADIDNENQLFLESEKILLALFHQIESIKRDNIQTILASILESLSKCDFLSAMDALKSKADDISGESEYSLYLFLATFEVPNLDELINVISNEHDAGLARRVSSSPMIEKVQRLYADEESVKTIRNLIDEQIAKDNQIAEEKKRSLYRQTKKKVIISFISVLIFLVSIISISNIVNNNKYEKAIAYYNEEEYIQAIDILVSLNNFKDSKTRLNEIRYNYVLFLIENHLFQEAFIQNEILYSNYGTAGLENTIYYEQGNYFLSIGEYDLSIEAFLNSENHSNSQEMISTAYYLMGVDQLNNGQYSDAIGSFEKATLHENAYEMISRTSKLSLIYAETGDIVYFGSYDLDGRYSDGDENGEIIPWLVLKNEDNKLMLISLYSVANRKFSASNSSFTNTWATSDIRAWLNSDFFDFAFSTQEKNSIVSSFITTPDREGRDGGVDTLDKVFLLSAEEALLYFVTNDDRILFEYDKNMPISNNWWLRSPASNSLNQTFLYMVSVVSKRGELTSNVLYNSGVIVNEVRPVVWIDLASDYFNGVE